MARRILGYAGDDALLRALAGQLQQDAVEHEEELSSADRIDRYMGSQRVLKSRGLGGASMRRSGG